MIDERPRAETPSRNIRRPFWIAAAIAIVVVVVDQLTKWWAITNLSNGQEIKIIGDAIRFRLTYNPGAAFGLGTGFTWVLAIIAAVAVAVICWYSWRVTARAWLIVLGMVLGGAITHLGDRLFREPGFARGHVVDFIAYGNLFIGNVADIMIVVGGALAALLVLLKRDSGRAPAARQQELASGSITSGS